MIDEKIFTKFLNETDIEGIVSSLANQLNRDYEGRQVVLIGVLKGACIFIADLCRKLKMDVDVDFVRLTAQGKGLTTPGTVAILKDISVDIRGKHVIIVEEIIDSGRTLKFLYDRVQASQPASVEVMTFLVYDLSRQKGQTPGRHAGEVRGPRDRGSVSRGLRFGSRRKEPQHGRDLLSEVSELSAPNST